MCDAVGVRPVVPLAQECFDMPDDIYKLLHNGTLLSRFKLFQSNQKAYHTAYEKGLVMEEHEYKSLHRELLWFFSQWDLMAEGALVGTEFAKVSIPRPYAQSSASQYTGVASGPNVDKSWVPNPARYSTQSLASGNLEHH
eukprot:6672431-Pyramimonas_sp.AAC.1